MKNKYYVVECVYVGPNPHSDGLVDFDYFEVTTDVPVTNMSGKVHLNGWLGTTNDISRHAHGEFETEEDARRYIEAHLLEHHAGWREDDCDYADPAVVAVYRLGSSCSMTQGLLWEMVDEDPDGRIGVDTPDHQLEQLAREYTDDLRTDGYNVSYERVLDVMQDYRDDLDTGED